MTDEEILNELLDIKHWWEQDLEDHKRRCEESRKQIEKNTRLITLLEEKMHNKKE